MRPRRRRPSAVGRARKWTRLRPWRGVALPADPTSSRATGSPSVPRTATASASGCTGAVTSDGVTVSRATSPRLFAVPRAPAGPSGFVAGTVRPGGRLVGPGLPCRRPGPPWGPGGGNGPRAGRVGSALPWQRDEICGEPTFLATSTKGGLPVPGKRVYFFPLFSF